MQTAQSKMKWPSFSAFIWTGFMQTGVSYSRPQVSVGLEFETGSYRILRVSKNFGKTLMLSSPGLMAWGGGVPNARPI
jgi:hypothetical protein